MLTAVLIDHFDSFTWNIKAWLSKRFEVTVVNCYNISAIHPENYNLVVLSPGPKSPLDYPESLRFLNQLPSPYPVLGICLGLQMMTAVENGKIMAYSPPVHGKKSLLVSHTPEFNNVAVARYHSLKCELPLVFQVLATADDIPMITLHQSKNWLGYQFHPESFMTEKADLFLDQVVSRCSL